MNTMATSNEGRRMGHKLLFFSEVDGVQKTRCYCCDRKKQVCQCMNDCNTTSDAIPHYCKILPKLPSEELTHYRDFVVDQSPPTKINVKTVLNNTFWTVDNNGSIITQKSKLQKSTDYIFWLQKCIAKCNNEPRLCYIIKWKNLYLKSYLNRKSLCLHFVEESERTDETYFIWEEQRKNKKYIISTLQSAVFKGYYITFDESNSSFSLQYKRCKKESSFVVHITGINIVDSFDCGGSDSDLSDSDTSDVQNPCPTNNTQGLSYDNSHDSSSSDTDDSNVKSSDITPALESLQMIGTENKQKRDQQVVKFTSDSDEHCRLNNSDDSILKNSSTKISCVPACFNFFCCCKR